MQGVNKERIDILLVEKGFFPTRRRAQSAIMAGLVYIDEIRIDKAGTRVLRDSNIHVKGDPIPYVSRGGLKLERGLERFEIPIRDRVFLDVGASTGGFTDCLLKNGAKKVYSIDVGYGQLDWRLRNDDRVVVLERTNIRYLEPETLSELAHGAVIDVSFISLRLVIPAVNRLLLDDSHIVALVKPQFEAGIKKVGKKGVISKPDVHEEVLFDILRFIESENHIVKDLTYSPIKGPEGNIEFLVHIHKANSNHVESFDYNREIPNIVQDAHEQLA